MLGIRISHTAHCFKIVQQAASWKTSHAQKQTTHNTKHKPTVKTKASKLQTRNGTAFLTQHILFAVVQRPTC